MFDQTTELHCRVTAVLLEDQSSSPVFNPIRKEAGAVFPMAKMLA